MAASHFALRTPAKPGTTARIGWPCSGASGSPFIAHAISTSGHSAFDMGIETP